MRQHDVVASGGIVDAEDAAAIMQISEYNTAGSNFEISEWMLLQLISAGSGVIENDGVFRIDVTDVADVSEGVASNALTQLMLSLMYRVQQKYCS